MNNWILLIIIITVLIIWFHFYVIKTFSYWSRIGVPQKSVFEQIVNTVRRLLQVQIQLDTILDFSKEFANKRYNGGYLLFRPTLYIRDPDLIKEITVKEFDHFVDHVPFLPTNVEPLVGRNLFNLQGIQWRNMRMILSPNFSSSKIKTMFVLINDCARQFVTHFKSNPDIQIVEMKDIMSRYTNDVVATTAFGINCDSLANPNNEFYLMGRMIANLSGVFKSLEFFVANTLPLLGQIFNGSIAPTEATTFLSNIVKETIQLREKNGIIRPDMIQLLMQARDGTAREHATTKDQFTKEGLTEVDITANVLVFFFAGFESTSTALSCLMHELAVNIDVQINLRKEVDEIVKSTNGQIDYESLLKMKYLHMVILEGLRKWPPLTEVTRLCSKPYTIHPLREGEAPVHIGKNDTLTLPIFEIHRNPQFYPNPNKFDPERFSEENDGLINPYAYIPFGSGPRKCIANRLALLELKLITFHIIANFELLTTTKTSIPLKHFRDLFNLVAENGYWLRLKPRQS